MILRLAALAMGTRFELVLAGEREAALRAAGEEALAEVEACDARWSAFRRDSLLSHLNRCAADGPVRVDADAMALLSACAAVHAASAGAFDPSVAPLMAALGFRGEPRESVAGARARVGFEHVRLDRSAGTVRYGRAGLALELGAIAKGHGLDLAGRALREAGVTCALLHGGTSTALALGPPPGADGWHVAVSDEPGAPVACLAHGALSVSAPGGRVVERHGRSHGHVLDPRRAASATGLRHVAALAPDATRADAWSTALVAGAPTAALPGDVEALLAAEPRDDAARSARAAPTRDDTAFDHDAASPPHDMALRWTHVAPRTGSSRITLAEPVLEDLRP